MDSTDVKMELYVYMTNNKKIKNATECEIDGIKFKSKLEKRAYELFKEARIDAKYEVDKIVLQSKFKPCNDVYLAKKGDLMRNSSTIREITYTPDFSIIYNGVLFYVEVKGFENDTFPLKRKLFLNIINGNNNVVYIEVRNIKQIRQAIKIIENL